MSVDEYYDKIISWLWNDEIPPSLGKEQREEFIKTVQSYERGSLDNDFLFYWMNGFKLKVLLSEIDRSNAVVKAHINDKGRHLNKDQTVYRLCADLKCHWKDMDAYVDGYIKNSCSVCTEKPPILETDFLADDEGPKMLAIEILGPLALSKRGNRFIGIVIDVDSRWINAVPMADYSTDDLVPLINESIEQFKPRKMYLIGMDADFAQRLNEEVQKTSVTSTNNDAECISYEILTHERNNSKNIEKIVGISFDNVLNRYIPALHRHVYSHCKNWDRSLQAVACDLRNHIWEDCGYSSFFAVFLQKPQSDAIMGDFNFSLSDDDSESSDCGLFCLKSKL